MTDQAHAILRIMALRHRPASYSAEIIDGVLAIVDTGKAGYAGPTVTNDADRVLAALSQDLGPALPQIVIYYDTLETWDGLDHANGVFQGFYALNETDRDRAIAKAKTRAAERTRRTP